MKGICVQLFSTRTGKLLLFFVLFKGLFKFAILPSYLITIPIGFRTRDKMLHFTHIEFNTSPPLLAPPHPDVACCCCYVTIDDDDGDVRLGIASFRSSSSSQLTRMKRDACLYWGWILYELPALYSTPLSSSCHPESWSPSETVAVTNHRGKHTIWPHLNPYQGLVFSVHWQSVFANKQFCGKNV